MLRAKRISNQTHKTELFLKTDRFAYEVPFAGTQSKAIDSGKNFDSIGKMFKGNNYIYVH